MQQKNKETILTTTQEAANLDYEKLIKAHTTAKRVDQYLMPA